MASTAHYVVESYADYLLARAKRLWERFQRTRIGAPESALAEAMVFRVLQACKVNPVAADMPGVGGPDFRCLGGTPHPFMVEATSLLPERVTKVSNIPNRVPEYMEGGPFGLLTAQIDETATKKRPQLKGISMSGILAIASTHFGAPLLMDAQAAMNALISQPSWVVGTDGMSTNLTYFLRSEEGEIVVKNPEISAVILVAVDAHRSYVCGAISPCPLHRLDTAPLWEIPFAYLKDWPVKETDCGRPGRWVRSEAAGDRS